MDNWNKMWSALKEDRIKYDLYWKKIERVQCQMVYDTFSNNL